MDRIPAQALPKVSMATLLTLPQKKRDSKGRSQLTPVPEFAPARNLRSMTGTSASPPSPAPTVNIVSKKQTKNTNPVNKRSSEQYRLLGSEVPDDMGGLPGDTFVSIAV
jgi:hypothetical protein